MITYRVNLYDDTDTVLMFADGFDSAYDAYMYAATEFDCMHAIPCDSLFYSKSADVWMYVDGTKVKRMWSFGFTD